MVTRSQIGQDFLYLQFSDIRDAAQAYEDARMGHWPTDYLNPKQLISEAQAMTNPNNPSNTFSNFEGLLTALVLFNPRNPSLTTHFVISVVKKALEKYGEVKAMHTITSDNPNVKAYLVEYYNVDSAHAASKALASKNLAVSPPLHNSLALLLKLPQHDISIKLEPYREDAADPDGRRLRCRRVEQPSVTGRSTVPLNDPNSYAVPPYHGLSRTGPVVFQHGVNAPAPNHNQVDIMRIRLGLDVRTTVCHLFILHCHF